MQLTIKSLLRRVQELPGFIITQTELVGAKDDMRIEVHLAFDPRHKPRCSECQAPCAGYDTLPERCWHYIPVWNIPVDLYDLVNTSAL